MKKRLLLLPALLAGLFACQQEKPSPMVVKTPDFQKAEGFYGRQNDSAFYYFNKVAGQSRDSLQIALAYNWMAEILSDAGDYFGSQENAARSLQFLAGPEPKEYSCFSADYNELGMTSLKLKHYDAAVDFYDQALKYTLSNEVKATIRNNQANAYQQQKNYVQAIRGFRTAIGLAPPDGKTYARVLTNLAFTQWLKQPGHNPIPDMLKALRIRQRENDLWGQNGSYAHLSDYYLLSKPDSALFYTQAMYAVARRINSPDDQLEALQKLIRLGPAQTAKPYFLAYQHLNDSLQDAHNTAKNQFALIRYETEKKQAENLQLQKDNAEKKYQIIKQRVLLYSGLFFFIGLSFFAVRWYRKRKQQQARETREAIKETQRKASKTVHDALGNDIYRILKNVQNESVLDRGWLVENIDGVYKRARNLSYEINIPTDERFPEHLSALLQSFGTDDNRVILVGNKASFWQKIHPIAKLELHYILQELMVNMQKHSQATNVVIKFEMDGSHGRITYFDDGVGIPPGMLHQNGLTNTGTRIKAINGAIIFDSHADKGLEIQLTFPIAK